jgi:hypothetical protein
MSTTYPSDLTDAEWERFERYLPTGRIEIVVPPPPLGESG